MKETKEIAAVPVEVFFLAFKQKYLKAEVFNFS